MAPQSANECYDSVDSLKSTDAGAQLGSQHAEPTGAQPAGKSNKPKPERHSRKCQICNHRQRAAIENDFLHWNRADWIQKRYGLHGKSTIYRHAGATGLDARRRETLYRAAEQVAEEVNRLEKPSAHAILSAVRTLASLNERGQWAEPRSNHEVVSTTAPPAQSADSSTTTVRRRAPRRSPMEMISNRYSREKLEIDPTHSKQTSEVVSNRHT